MTASLMASFRGWLETSDPGAVRRRRGLRAALAALSVWVTLRAILGIVPDPPPPTVAFFGVVASFVCSLAIADPRRRDRVLTLAGSAAVLGLAAALAAVARQPSWLASVVLLGLVFLSFAARRRSLRTAELAIIATMGLYFADVSHVRVADVPWFAAAAAIGVCSVAAWQLVLIPYDPAGAIVAAGRAFAHRAADLVAVIEGVVGDGRGAASDRIAGDAGDGAVTPPPDVGADVVARLEQRMRQVRASRLVIESQFPGALAPTGWTRDRLQVLQVAFFEAELGLRLLVDACGDPAALDAIPVEIRDELHDLLDALVASLRNASDIESMRRLEQRSETLREGASDYAQRVSPAWQPGAPPPPWIGAAVRLARGSRQVARALATVRGLQAPTLGPAADSDGPAADSESAPAAGSAPAPAASPAGGPAPRPAGIPQPRGPLGLHPTTVLGIQAVVATGLAMAVASVVDPGHANWVFWTAFVVIAGSSGETLRRILMRIAGTLAGVALGVALAVVLPNDAALVIAIATVAVFLTIYWAPVSYAVMVVWLNAGFILVAAQLGARELDLLVQRPTAVFLGAAIAAVVAVTVLPMPLVARYRAAVMGFLGAVDAALGGMLVADPGPGASAPRPAVVGAAAVAGVDAAYRRVEAVLPGVAFEGNLLASARTPLAGKAAEVGAVASAMTRLARAVDAERDEGRPPGRVAVAVAERIRENIAAIASAPAGGPGRVRSSMADMLEPGDASRVLARVAGLDSTETDDHAGATSAEGVSDGAPESMPRGAPGPAGEGILSILVEIHAGVVELARGLGVAVVTEPGALLGPSTPSKEP
jgi:hypothetical protein